MVLLYKDAIFQEGNPYYVVKGIGKLIFTKNNIAKISDNPEKYIIISYKGYQPFINLMIKDGFAFKEQMGASLVFEKDNKKMIAATRMFTRYFQVIQVDKVMKDYINNKASARDPLPSDFKLIFKYGVEGRNILDTFNGKFTKDMVVDPPIIIDLSLTKEEKQIIYNKMKEIDIFSYPQTFDPVSNMQVTPYQSYYFKVIANNITKEIEWDDKHASGDDRAIKLRELIDIIKVMIYDKDEYKKLPQPRGGYD